MKELISFIEENLNRERLEQISALVIEAYKNEDNFILNTYAGSLQLDCEDFDRKRLFYRIIQQLHPDKLPLIKAEYELAVASSNSNKLKRIKALLDLKVKALKMKSERFEYEHHESYQFDRTEFDTTESLGEDRGFVEAVKNVIFGNHNFQIDPADLGQIDGSLDVGAYELENMDGIEYCRNVRVLNISNNIICNIFDLQHLNQLEELYAADNQIRDIEVLGTLEYLEIVDLSENDIEDISPLQNMSGLKFVDIRNNPIQNDEIIYKLIDRGVIVLN